MQRLTEYAAFPAIAGALGAGAGVLAARSAGVDAPEAAALGLGVFAAALSLRNWGLGRIERPLLAEELTGVHERLESLQADAVDLRELLTDLAGIVEEVSTREQEALRSLAARVRALETEAGEAEATDDAPRRALPDLSSAMAPIERRLEQFEARTRKLALAMETAFGAEILSGREAQDAPEEAQELLREAQEATATGDLEEDQVSFERIAEAAVDAPRADAPEEEAFAPAPTPAPQEAAAFEERLPTAGRDYALIMQAVFSVPDGEPRYFEAFTRRYDAAGGVMPEADHIDDAKADGSISAIDNLLLVRCVAAAEQLRAADREVAIFCNLSVQSLRDPVYLRSLISFLRKNQALSRNLVFEFSQLDLDEVFDPDVAALQRLQETGFAFSIDHLSDWSIDIAHLAKIGFRFVKLDAASLLSRERATPGATRRLAKSFDRAGLTLVVEKVESAEDASELREAGARLMQGSALSEPRMIQVEDEDFQALEDAARRAMAAGAGLGRDAPAAPRVERTLSGGGFDGALVERALRSLGAIAPSGAPAHNRPD